MNTNRERNSAVALQGNLLRLSERREIAIYLHDGTVSIADFNDGRGELDTAGALCGMGGNRLLAHAQRWCGVETIFTRACIRRADRPAGSWTE